MNYQKIIITISLLISLLLFKKTKPKLLVGILVGLIFTLVLSLMENKLPTTITFISFGILSLIFSVFSGVKTKWLNLIIGVFAFFSFLSKLMHFSFANELKLLMILPIISFGLVLANKSKYQKELSILTIFVGYELIEFIKLTEQWMK